jgi:hypothetical protein
MAYDLSKAQLRFTKEQFKATNPTPAADVLCVETDSNVYTTGDGTSAYLSIRGNTSLSGDQRTHADTAYALMQLSDTRDEVGEAGSDPDGAIGFEMLFDTGTAGDPGAQSFNFDNATPASITLMRITVIDVDGESNASALSIINPRRGEFQVTHEDGTMLLTINGDGALNGTFYEAPVDYVSGPLPANNAECRVVYLPGRAAQWYNGSEVVLQEAIITGVTDGSGRLAIDMSGAPYAWTNIRAVVYSGEDGASQGSYTTLSANTGRIQFLDPVGDPSGSDIAVTAILKGI